MQNLEEITNMSTHPERIIVDYNQGKLVPFVNLVFSSDKHLNHLLRYVQGICFRPEHKNNRIRLR